MMARGKRSPLTTRGESDEIPSSILGRDVCPSGSRTRRSPGAGGAAAGSGMAVVDITPPVQQKAGPLKARCVVFRQGKEQAAVVVGESASSPPIARGPFAARPANRPASRPPTSWWSLRTPTAAPGTSP